MKRVLERLTVLKAHGGPLAVLSLLVVVLAAVNFSPGSWLSGWDNLHPEFNFGLNIGRSLSSVWQEYQGLGLLGGMSHAADLPRQLFLFVISIVIPPQLHRYLWVWLSWWCGAVGAYFLALLLFSSKDERPSRIARAAGLVAGSAYLLNLAMVQYFYVPYESFSSFFGGLPWLLWAVSWYYRSPSSRRLAALFLISLVASSAFYVQTLFVVFVMLVAVMTLCQLAVKKLSVKDAFLAGVVLLAANAFWLLPSAYFTLTSAQVTINSKVNRLSTFESQLMNQAYGTPLNIALLKGYWLNYQDFQNGSYSYLMPEWRAHTDQGYVVGIGVTLWVLSALGILLTVRRGSKLSVGWLCCFVLVTVMLSSGNGPLGAAFNWASRNIPLFGQVFRTAFTKWSVAAALVYAIGLGSWSYWLLSQFRRNQIMLAGLWVFLTTAALSCVVWPAFQGRLISPLMRLAQPAAYQELFRFLASEPKQARVITLPLPDFWAWNFYSWDYRGSGFLWYGIEQPIVDRNFDVWSANNETLYNQLSTAFFGKDEVAFGTVLQQYDIRYAVLDESITVPNRDVIPAQVTQLKEMLATLGAERVWSQDFLTVYKLPTGSTQFVTSPKSYTPVWQVGTYTRLDPAYQEVGPYISAAALRPSVIYPFAQLSREQWASAAYVEDTLRLKQELPYIDSSAQLVIPSIATGSAYPVQVALQRSDGQLELRFAAAGELSIAEQTRPLPQLPTLTLPIKSALNENSFGTLSLNGQTVRLATGAAEAQSWVTLRANSPITVLGEITTEGTTEDLSLELPSEYWSNLAHPTVIPVSTGRHTLQLSIPVQWSTVPLAELESQNCDVFRRGSYSVQHQTTGTVYEASDYAGVCTGTTLPLLNTRLSGLLRLSGENILGRSIKFYVSDPATQRADLEELLARGNFDETYALLGWPNLPAQQYGINWETRSFGQNSLNKLSTVEVMPINLERLIRMKIVLSEQPQVENLIEQSNNWKIGTYQYGTTVNSARDASIITLAQGYDPGWLGIALPLQESILNHIGPLPHVTYNGWANAWIVPRGQYQVIIIYWPQLLGFLGDVIVLLGLISCLRLLLQKRRSS